METGRVVDAAAATAPEPGVADSRSRARRYFKVPPSMQGRALKWGIIGAVLMRGVMILVGVELVQRFRSVTLVFAGILLASAVKLLTEGDHDDDMGENGLVALSRKMLRSVSYYDGDRFFTTTRDGLRAATPLLLCVVCIELSDFVFAVDSIPAVLAISKDPFIVYSSNIFAIAALRSLYQVLAAAIEGLPYLRPAVALILGFVGVKMLAEYLATERKSCPLVPASLYASRARRLQSDAAKIIVVSARLAQVLPRPHTHRDVARGHHRHPRRRRRALARAPAAEEALAFFVRSTSSRALALGSRSPSPVNYLCG